MSNNYLHRIISFLEMTDITGDIMETRNSAFQLFQKLNTSIINVNP